jgi:hypothetical protein
LQGGPPAEIQTVRGDMMDHTRRYFLHLTAGTLLTAIFEIVTAQAWPAHFMVGYPRQGATEFIASLIRQWVAEWQGHPSVAGDRMNAQNGATAAIELGWQRAVPAARLAFITRRTPVIDILRSWAHQKQIGIGRKSLSSALD